MPFGGAGGAFFMAAREVASGVGGGYNEPLCPY